VYTKLALAALTTFMFACGGSSNNEGGSQSTACVITSGGAQTCSQASNIDTATKNAENTECTEENGTVASSCPTASLDGCCQLTNNGNGIKSTTCYYQNNAAAEQSACTQSGGTWSTTP
jgi:hypothetical protein